MKRRLLGIYIHIPFCLRKCPYCDFYSTQNHDKELRERFIRALCKEIKYYGQRYNKKYYVDSIYFGGGTPTIFQPWELEIILNQVRDSFHVIHRAEISMECNPATANAEKMRGYRDLGIKRLSIGAQSFDNKVLKTLGRLHNSDDIRKTMDYAFKGGFRNISLDLMFGIPGQSFASWSDTLRAAMNVNPQHISLYSLEFMEDTWFWRWREQGKMQETSAEDDRVMYEYAIKLMAEKGFEQYEISNVAKGEKYRCRHNLKYWELEDYLGFGPSAHSFTDNVRHSNVSRLDYYLDAIEKQDMDKDILIGETNAYGTRAVDGFIKNSYRDNVAEYIFTGLRKNEGLDLEKFRQRFERDIWDIYDEKCRRDFDEFVKGGFAKTDGENIRLTLKGMNVSNRIMSLFV
ncbi:MAG: radical SAM family heme chaperone HemW [Firmicutes bacterium]|nr:radical SAM family heme chaperone HemW [Bacillota bacterium]